MKLVWIGVAAAATLCAADFWVAKPYTDWSEKETGKMITDSPWAKRVSISMGMMPQMGGAPEVIAIPMENGKEIIATISPDRKSYRQYLRPAQPF